MRPDYWDIVALSGLGIMATGAYLVYPPAAYILVGLIVMCLGSQGSRARARVLRNRAGKDAGGG